MDRKIRKYHNNLVVSGAGVILFGVWGVIKTFIVAFYSTMEDYNRFARESGNYILYKIVFIITLLLFCAIEMGLRLYIGGNAILEGQGKRRKNKYIVFSIVYMILTIIEILFLIFGNVSSVSSLELTVTCIMEISSFYVLLEMINSAIRVKMARRKAELGD